MSKMAAPVIVSIVVVVGIAVGWGIRRFCTPLPKQKAPKSKTTIDSQAQGAQAEEQVYHTPSHKSDEGLFQRPPKVRTVEEIKAQYGRSSNKTDQFKDNSAAEAKRKLMERGQKLGEINEKTEELQADAETFSSLAEELAKKMKNRKWWEL